MTFSNWYTFALHLAGVISISVLLAISVISWAIGGPILLALIGYGIGVGVTPTSSSTVVTPTTPVQTVVRSTAPQA